jgi:hypothetical protein
MLKQLLHKRFTIRMDANSLWVKYADNDAMQSNVPVGNENDIKYKQPAYVCT